MLGRRWVTGDRSPQQGAPFVQRLPHLRDHPHEHLETMPIWQRLQVRQALDTPLILVGNMWPGLLEWARRSKLSIDPPLANVEDMAIPRCVANADAAIALIREHHQLWLSRQENGRSGAMSGMKS
jgi:hypothetical protein